MVQKALTYKAKMHELNSIFFYQLTVVSNNHVLVSYLSGIYLESWFYWLVGGLQKALKKRRKQTKEKHWKMNRKKNEECKESQSQITAINIITFHIKNYILLGNIVKKKQFLPSYFIYSSYALQDIWNEVMITKA